MKPELGNFISRWIAVLISVYLFLSLMVAVFLAEGTVHLPRRAVTHERQFSKILESRFHAELQDISVTEKTELVS